MAKGKQKGKKQNTNTENQTTKKKYFFNSQLIIYSILGLAIIFALTNIVAARYNETGLIELSKKNYRKAKASFTTAISLSLFDPEYYYNRALTCYKLYDIKGTEADLNLAIYWQTYNPIEIVKNLVQTGNSSFSTNLKKFQQIVENTSHMLQKQQNPSSLQTIKNLSFSKDQDKIKEYVSPKVELHEFAKEFRGFIAIDEIEENEAIMKVPVEECITSFDLAQNRIGSQIINETSIKMQHQFGIALSELRKNKSKKFEKALKYLPTSYDFHPLKYSEEDLKLLEVSHLSERIRDKQNKYRETYDLICNKTPEFKQYTYDEYIDNVLVADTRSFQFFSHEVLILMITPFLDLVNHSSDEKNTVYYFDSENQTAILKAIKPIKKGQQIFDNYGKKERMFYFLNYGFIPKDQMNLAIVNLTLHINDKYYKRKAELINYDQPKQLFLTSEYSSLYFSNILSCLRFTEANTKSLMKKIDDLFDQFTDEQLKEKVKGLTLNFIPILSQNNEIAMLKRLNHLVTSYLKKFSTTIAEDNEILQKQNLTQAQQFIISWRKQEKEVFQVLKTFSEIIPHLYEKSFQEIQVEIKYNQYAPFKDYIDKVLIPFKYQQSKESSEKTKSK